MIKLQGPMVKFTQKNDQPWKMLHFRGSELLFGLAFRNKIESNFHKKNLKQNWNQIFFLFSLFSWSLYVTKKKANGLPLRTLVYRSYSHYRLFSTVTPSRPHLCKPKPQRPLFFSKIHHWRHTKKCSKKQKTLLDRGFLFPFFLSPKITGVERLSSDRRRTRLRRRRLHWGRWVGPSWVVLLGACGRPGAWSARTCRLRGWSPRRPPAGRRWVKLVIGAWEPILEREWGNREVELWEGEIWERESERER